jgi:hypothetical protein
VLNYAKFVLKLTLILNAFRGRFCLSFFSLPCGQGTLIKWPKPGAGSNVQYQKKNRIMCQDCSPCFSLVDKHSSCRGYLWGVGAWVCYTDRSTILRRFPRQHFLYSTQEYSSGLMNRTTECTLHRVETAAFWRTFSDEGKVGPGWWGWGGARPPPLITFTITSKVAVYAPAEWADTLTLFQL